MHQPGAKPPLIAWDVVVAVAVLVFTLMLGGFALLAGFFSLAFLDNCPIETCSASGAFTAVAAAIVGAGIVGVVGVIWTVSRIVRRKISWPVAVGTFAVCLLVLGAGIVGYAAAVA